jgi:hypothetical protein
LGINRYVVEHQVKWFVGIQRLDFVAKPSETRLATMIQLRF